ncbi:cell division protein FtsL, partial [Zavarzinia sp.]|uniref:cell division protein FtsL n=1 Tax=Zavarzinia sp. TaxID=2027920 RepID=UPI003BB692E7
MSRILTLAAIGLAVGTAATLYQVKYEVRLLEQEARELHRGVTRERQSIQVLDAEWAFMNQPSRIQDLAERYLDLKPVKPSQITSIDRLPMRPVEPAPAPGSATPGEGLIAYALPPGGTNVAGVPMPT